MSTDTRTDEQKATASAAVSLLDARGKRTQYNMRLAAADARAMSIAAARDGDRETAAHFERVAAFIETIKSARHRAA